MKSLSLIITTFLFLIPAFSQSTDSITLMINNYDYQGALMEINKIHEDSMDNETLYLKALALKSLSKFPEAIVCFDSLYRQDTASIRITLDLADCYKSLLDYKRPLDLYHKALAIHPENKYLLQLLAGVCMTTEQFYKAKAAYLSACNADTSAFLLKQIALCYEKLAQDDSAIFYHKRAIQWNSNDYQPVFRLGNLYKAQRRYDLGIGITDTFLSRISDNRDVSRLSGYLHYLNQDLPGAIKRFQHCLTISDTSLFVYKYLGYSYFKQNEFPNAIKYLEKVYFTDSSDVELCYALALAHDPPANIRYFYAAANLGLPVIDILAKVYTDLSLALTKTWRYDEALNALIKASELVPLDFALLYKIGIHYDNWMDDKPMALKYYRDFLSTRTDTNSIYIVTGTSVIDQGDYHHAENRIKEIENWLNPPPKIPEDTVIKSESGQGSSSNLP